MQHVGRREQYTLVFSLTTLVIAVLAAFIFLTDGVLRGIAVEEESSRRLLSDWLACKGDCIAYLVLPSGGDAAALNAEIAACGNTVSRLEKSPLWGRMLSIEGMPQANMSLSNAWRALESEVLGLLTASPGGAGLYLEHMRGSSAFFEATLKSRIALISRFEEGQRGAIRLVQASLAFAIIALAAIGLWAIAKARRSQEGERRLRELVAATYAAQESERRRIALDLHDSVAQELAAALMAAGRLPRGEGADYGRAIAGLKSSLDLIRRVSWEMRPPELERLGFKVAAIRLFDEFEGRSGMRIEMDELSWDASGIEDDVALHLYRILQEGLANAEKHARGTKVRVSVRRSQGRLGFCLEDDGIGFDPEDLEIASPSPGHMGIAGMRERARFIGGSLELASSPGKGARIYVEVPCAD
jgi:signal transduction histidine kinase